MAPVRDIFIRSLKDASSYFSADIISRSISFLILPIIARLFSIEEFAVYDLFVIVSGFVVALCVLGMDSGSPIMIAESVEDEERLSLILRTQILFSVLALLGLWLTSRVLVLVQVNLFFSPEVLNYMFLSSFFYMITYLCFNFLKWKGEAKWAAAINLCSTSIGILTGFAIVLLTENKKIEFFIMGMALGNSVGMIIAIVLTRRYLFSLDFSKIGTIRKELLQLSLPFIPNYIANRFMRFLDRLIILSFLDQQALGYYAFVSRISNIPYVVLSSLANGIRPMMFNNYKNDEGRKFIKKVFEWFMWLTPVMIIATIMLASPLITLMGGEKYIGAVTLVPILVLASLGFSSVNFGGFGYAITRKTYYIPLLLMGAIIVNILISIGFVNTYGILAVGGGTMISSILYAFCYTYFSERLYSFDYNLRNIALLFLLNIGIIVFIKWFMLLH